MKIFPGYLFSARWRTCVHATCMCCRACPCWHARCTSPAVKLPILVCGYRSSDGFFFCAEGLKREGEEGREVRRGGLGYELKGACEY